MDLDVPTFCKVILSCQPTWFMLSVPSFAFWSSAQNLAIPALPVSYTFPPLRHVRDFHPLEKSAAKRTKLLQRRLSTGVFQFLNQSHTKIQLESGKIMTNFRFIHQSIHLSAHHHFANQNNTFYQLTPIKTVRIHQMYRPPKIFQTLFDSH